MKMLTLAILLVVIQLSIGLFDNTISVDGEAAVPTMYGSNVSIDSTTNYLYDFVTNPLGWGDSNFIIYLIGVTATLAAAAIAAGFLRSQPSDSIYFAPLFVVFLGLGAIPVVGLFNVINREIGAFACVAGSYCTPAIIAGSLTAGLLGLAWVMACVNWWRTGSTGN